MWNLEEAKKKVEEIAKELEKTIEKHAAFYKKELEGGVKALAYEFEQSERHIKEDIMLLLQHLMEHKKTLQEEVEKPARKAAAHHVRKLAEKIEPAPARHRAKRKRRQKPAKAKKARAKHRKARKRRKR